MKKRNKIAVMTAAALSVASIAGVMTANADTVYDDGYTFSCYDCNKDGSVDAFDLACLKRFLLNDAPETPDYAIENYQRVNNALASVREFLEAGSPDWYARVTNIEMDTQTYEDGTLNANLCIATVTFDQTLTEDAVYRLTEGVYDDIENYVSYVEKNACNTVRITVSGGGDITSCVPVANGELNIAVDNTSDNQYVMMATEYLAENNASWYARMSSMDVSYTEDTADAVVTMVFDQNLNEDAIYTLTESECDNVEDTVTRFTVNPTNVMRMVITDGGTIKSCVPVYTEQQAVAVTETVMEDTPESVIPMVAKTHMAETCPSWYARMSSMDVEITQDDAVITVVFDRPLDTVAVELMFVGELKSAYESALTLVEQNETSTMKMVIQDLEIVAFEPVIE